MANPLYVVRKGSVQGSRHVKLRTNNQDVVETMEFRVPRWGKTYRIGIVSDGCSGIPAFTRSEVGAGLLTVFCLGRIQELIVGGAKLAEIPLPLYHAVTSFLRDLANTVMPANVYWPYPVTFKGNNEFRNDIKAPQRFMIDYLSATILGFVDDGETLVTFQAGDGVRIVNDEVVIVDQNNTPCYPSVSINSPGASFDVAVYPSAEVTRLALASDGLKDLLLVPDTGLPQGLFLGRKADGMALQFLFNRLSIRHAGAMKDDCSAITRERFGGVNDDQSPAGA